MAPFYAKSCVFFVLIIERKQLFKLNMESINLSQTTLPGPARATRRKVDGAVTAATLIQMASEILSASPTLRHKLNITLTDLAAAEKVRRELIKKPALRH